MKPGADKWLFPPHTASLLQASSFRCPSKCLQFGWGPQKASRPLVCMLFLIWLGPRLCLGMLPLVAILYLEAGVSCLVTVHVCQMSTEFLLCLELF